MKRKPEPISEIHERYGDLAEAVLETLLEKMWFREGLPSEGWALAVIGRGLDRAARDALEDKAAWFDVIPEKAVDQALERAAVLAENMTGARPREIAATIRSMKTDSTEWKP
jgi:hypothetical protein